MVMCGRSFEKITFVGYIMYARGRKTAALVSITIEG
jgi:hypothetical protein